MIAGLFADTASRVTDSTEEALNRRIQFLTEASVLHYAQRPELIGARLRELEREWDIERSLQLNAGAVISTGFLLGLLKKPFQLLPLAGAAFMFTHAINGWCPPLAIMRRMGVRTEREINRERFALKALRGDFEGVGPSAAGSPAEKAKKVLQAVSAEPPPVPAVAPQYEEPVNVP